MNLEAMWQRLEEQLVAAAHRGVVPVHFQHTQSCLNSQTQNLRQPLAVVEGKKPLDGCSGGAPVSGSHIYTDQLSVSPQSQSQWR